MTKGPAKAADPLDVNARLYRQIARLLDEMEAADMDDRMTFPQRISALIAIGRIQKIFVDLRKGDYDGSAGSKIREYASAFASADAVGGRANRPRSAPTPIRFDRRGDGDDDSAA
jgi:hypothetical protein